MEREGRVAEAYGADRLAERDRDELVEGAHDRRRDPPEREQVGDGDHAGERVPAERQVGGNGHGARGAGREEDEGGGEVLAGQAKRRRLRAREARRAGPRRHDRGRGGGHAAASR